MLFGIGTWEILLVSGLVGLLGSVFWIWMIVDCAMKEPSEGNDKLVWIIIIVFTHFIGAVIYFFARRPQRRAELGA